MNHLGNQTPFIYEKKIGVEVRADGFRPISDSVLRRESPGWMQELEFLGSTKGRAPVTLSFRLMAVAGPKLGWCLACGVPPQELKAIYLERVRPFVPTVEGLFDGAVPEDIPLEGKWGDTPYSCREAMLFATELRWSKGRFTEAAAFCSRGLTVGQSPWQRELFSKMLTQVQAGVPYAERTWGLP